MNPLFRTLSQYCCCICATLSLLACAGDPMESGLDPFAPMVFKEGKTTMPLTAPNPATTVPFYVTETTIFKFAVDTNSILIGEDGITRYIVITNPSGGEQIQYEGIRCDTSQWRLYGTFDNSKWNENPLSSWNSIKYNVPNRYQASLASGAFCNINTQVKDIKAIRKSLNPNGFIGGRKPSNSTGEVL
jgi:CNP1-like family